MFGADVSYSRVLLVAVFLSRRAPRQPSPRLRKPARRASGSIVDHQSPSWHQWRVYRRSGQRQKAALIWKIAREPKALWLGRFTRPHFNAEGAPADRRARSAQGAVPILTVMRAESTGCGPDLHGRRPGRGRPHARLVRRLARAIGGDRVVIAFEPDSLGTIDCHARSRRDDRLRLLRYGVKVLVAASRTPPSTSRPAPRTGSRRGAPRASCAPIGIARVRGFMLNATHYDWTQAQHQARARASRA